MIKTVDVRHKTFENYILLLGFFDCLHSGHIALIKEARKLAESCRSKVAMLTFTNDPAFVLGDSCGSVFTFLERVKKAERLGVDCILYSEFDEGFKKLSFGDFFNLITENHAVKGIVCGYDFTYGANAEGNVKTLQAQCDDRGIILKAVGKQSANGERISTTLIKKYLSVGNVEAANELLCEPYSLIGEVEHGRQIGRTIGFPTANIEIPTGKMPIRSGVYKTFAEIDGKIYNGITNYGDRPTFSLDKVLTETYFDGFNGDIYGQELCVYFDKYIRPVKKFENAEELSEQLKKDLENIR